MSRTTEMVTVRLQSVTEGMHECNLSNVFSKPLHVKNVNIVLFSKKLMIEQKHIVSELKFQDFVPFF